jgi:hypothetical protein
MGQSATSGNGHYRLEGVVTLCMVTQVSLGLEFQKDSTVGHIDMKFGNIPVCKLDRLEVTIDDFGCSLAVAPSPSFGLRRDSTPSTSSLRPLPSTPAPEGQRSKKGKRKLC